MFAVGTVGCTFGYTAFAVGMVVPRLKLDPLSLVCVFHASQCILDLSLHLSLGVSFRGIIYSTLVIS